MAQDQIPFGRHGFPDMLYSWIRELSRWTVQVREWNFLYAKTAEIVEATFQTMCSHEFQSLIRVQSVGSIVVGVVELLINIRKTPIFLPYRALAS